MYDIRPSFQSFTRCLVTAALGCGLAMSLQSEEPPLEPIPLPMPQELPAQADAPTAAPVPTIQEDTPYVIDQLVTGSPPAAAPLVIEGPSPFPSGSPQSMVAPQPSPRYVPRPAAPGLGMPRTPSPTLAGRQTIITHRVVYVVDPLRGIARPVTVVSLRVPSHVAGHGGARFEEHVVIAPAFPPGHIPGQPIRNAIRRRLLP